MQSAFFIKPVLPTEVAAHDHCKYCKKPVFLPCVPAQSASCAKPAADGKPQTDCFLPIQSGHIRTAQPAADNTKSSLWYCRPIP